MTAKSPIMSVIDELARAKAVLDTIRLMLNTFPAGCRHDIAAELRIIADGLVGVGRADRGDGEPHDDHEGEQGGGAETETVGAERNGHDERLYQYRRSEPHGGWAAVVPYTDESRVDAVRRVLAGGPVRYTDALKKLPGWRSIDLSAVLVWHPETFRPAVDDQGHKAWELGAAEEAPPGDDVEPPYALDDRCREIAAVLADGPLMPYAIHARLRWRKSFISSALTRQRGFPNPWFQSVDAGWELTEWARHQMGLPAAGRQAQAAERKMAQEFSLLTAALSGRTSPASGSPSPAPPPTT